MVGYNNSSIINGQTTCSASMPSASQICVSARQESFFFLSVWSDTCQNVCSYWVSPLLAVLNSYVPVSSFRSVGVRSGANWKSCNSLHRLGLLLADNITIPTMVWSLHAQIASRSPEVCFVFRFVLVLSRHAWRNSRHVTQNAKTRTLHDLSSAAPRMHHRKERNGCGRVPKRLRFPQISTVSSIPWKYNVCQMCCPWRVTDMPCRCGSVIRFKINSTQTHTHNLIEHTHTHTHTHTLSLSLSLSLRFLHSYKYNAWVWVGVWDWTWMC